MGIGGIITDKMEGEKMENIICLRPNYLQLCGFVDIQDKATFGLYPGGIVIFSNEKKTKRDYYYNVNVDDDHKINDRTLLEILKERGIKEETRFIKIKDAYIELYPKEKKYKKFLI